MIDSRRILVFLLCAFASGTVLAAERTFDRVFNVSTGGQLTLDTDTGSVAIVGGQGHEVVVHAEISGSNDFLSHFHVQAAQGARGVTVTGRAEHRFGFDNWFDFGRHKVLFTISVPSNYAVDIHTAGGSLDLRHLNASARGTTSGGSVNVRDAHGSIYMETSGGRIDGAQLVGPVQLRSSGGGIEVTGCTGDIDVSTSGGAIRLAGIDGKVRAETAGGSVDAEIRANRGVSLATSGGGITLLLPADAHGSIDAHTDGGWVDSAIPLSTTEVASRDELRGTINGGGEPIVLRTSGGSIHVGPASRNDQ